MNNQFFGDERDFYKYALLRILSNLQHTMRSFMIVIVAGVGNIPGIIASALGLGMAEELSDYVLGTEFRLAFVFSLLVAILVFRNWQLTRKRLYLK